MKREPRYRSLKAFTLIEVLVVLGVMAFMAAVIAPGFFGLRGRQVVNSMTNRIVADLRNVSERARAQHESSQWGIRFTNPTGASNDYYEIWYGADYATGTKIARIALSPGLNLTDPPDNSSKDVIFSKATGLPASSTTVSLYSTNVSPNHAAVVFVSSSGKIDFEVASNLVGYWDFNEGSGTTANDNAGLGNNGSLLPALSPPTWQTSANCKSGGCLSFNGTSQYVDAGNGTNLNVTSSFSLGAWIKTSSAALAYIIAKRNTDLDASIAYNLNIVATSGFGQFYVSNGTTNANVSGTTNLADGTFHHLMGVFESGTAVKVYVDGTLQTTTTTGITSVNTNTAPFTIASKSDGSSGFFNGSIDGVRIYTRALSASEVTTLYNMFNR